jgi:hypothetical protein
MVCFGDTLTVTHAQGLGGGTKIYKQNADSVFLLLVKSDSGDFVAQGSGFLIKGQKIVTNAHVANAGKICLVLGAAKIPTKLDSIDTYHDLAVLGTDNTVILMRTSLLVRSAQRVSDASHRGR